MVLEQSGKGSDFSVGTMCQELTGSRWRVIVTHKTSQSFEQKGACGRTLCQVQKTLQSGEEPTPEADTERDTGIFTNLTWLGVLYSPPLVPLLKKGP